MPVLFLWHDVHAWCCFRKVQLIFLPPGTCPTASYKFQPWNQICCELCRRVVQGVTFFITLASIIGETALPFHDSTHLFILPSTVTNCLHQQNGSCGNSLERKKRIWRNWSAQTVLLVIQLVANLKYGMQLILNTFGNYNLSTKKRTQHWHIMFSFSNPHIPKQWEKQTDQACKNYSICRTTVE